MSPSIGQIGPVRILPYDVLQVRYSGQGWLDYASIKEAGDVPYACGRVLYSTDPEFRVVRAGVVIVDRSASPYAWVRDHKAN